MFFDDFARDKETISAMPCFLDFKDSIAKKEEFLENMSELIFDQPILCISKDKTYILDSMFLKSAIKTLNSITVCCSYSCFADANVLIRKYRDDLFLYLFIINVLENRKGLSEEEIREITEGGMNADKMLRLVALTMKVINDGSRKNINDKAVDAWFDNEALSGKYKKELSIENYLKNLRQDPDIEKIILEHELNPIWESIRQRLNNYTHSNGKRLLEHNLFEYMRKGDFEDCFLSIIQDISFITSVFLIILILLKPNFIMASDYVDSLEFGIEPPQDSQYWVAPFIQEYIDESIIKLHPELKSFLKKNNKYGMQID